MSFAKASSLRNILLTAIVEILIPAGVTIFFLTPFVGCLTVAIVLGLPPIFGPGYMIA